MLRFSTLPQRKEYETKFRKEGCNSFLNIVKKNATLAWGGGRCRYIPRFVSPLSIFRKVQSENSLETFKILNSTQVRSKGCFKTGLILTKQFCMFFYLESWMAGDILKTGNVINHLTFPPLTRFWTWTIIDQTIANPITVPKTQVKPGQSVIFSLVCHKLSTKGFSDIKAPCKQGIRWTYNSF